MLFRYLGEYRRILFGALALAVINQVFSLLDPQILRLIIDNYASRVGTMAPVIFLRGVAWLILASMGVAFVSRVAKNFQDYYVNVVTQRVGARLYGESIAHAFSLPYAVFEDQRSGELLQKLQKARLDVQNLVSNFVNIVFLSLVGIAFVVTYAFAVHWIIGLAYFLVLPIVGGVTFWIGRRIRDAQRTIVRETAELAGATTETLRNVELVKSLGLEDQETKRLNEVNTHILGLELKKVRTIRTLSFIQGTTINATRSGIMLLMLWFIATGTITLGEFFSLLFYSFAIFGPLGDLGTVSQNYQEARASLERVEEVLAAKPAPKAKDPVDIGALTNIEFKKVIFAYEGQPPALRGVDISLKSGETIAFVGPSGSGKTTLVKLLVGLYRPTSGQALVNGTASEHIDYELIRRRIGYVSQETQLFAGTIRENLLFVRPGATDEECLTALRQAAALPIIERGGKGLETKIGEGGIKISGGERQRLAIARALLRDPDLVIFDEATSSLDSLTEKSITETIKEITKTRPNLMTVMVAHRLSTVMHADRLYVLAKGRLEEQGTHEALLKKGGLYAALWREQGASNGNGGVEMNTPLFSARMTVV
ncbi:MAG TPA: ABC transporter ATP-binding protein [Candidatus Paceibacterota bacterium]|nr:ABC transporter ATP-binding protein [Candidatus Paceibacterota bacterium]